MLNTSRVLGPAVGALLLAVWGAWFCFAVNAVSFLPVLLVLLVEKTPADPPAAVESHRMREGLRYAWGHPAIRTCVLLAVCAGCVFNLAVPMPLMAATVFHAGRDGFGFMVTAFGVGALPGAILSGSRPGAPRPEEVTVLAVATGGVVVACSFAPSLPAMLAALSLVGAVSIWFIARANAFVLLETPQSLRGRVMGVWTLALPGSYVLTGFPIGYVSQAVSPRAGYAMAGAALIVVAATGARSMARATSASARRSCGHPRRSGRSHARSCGQGDQRGPCRQGSVVADSARRPARRTGC